MGLLLLYWSFMLAAYIIAAKNRHRADKLAFVQRALMPVVYILVLIMGLRMGVNEQVTSNLGTIGVQSLIITVFAVVGSMLFITGVRKIMGMDKYGNLKTKVEPKADAEEDKAIESASGDEQKLSKSDIMSTCIILGLVVVGMLIGYFVIAGMMPQILDEFDVISGHSLTVFLCCLLFCVGFDLGMQGTVISSIKEVGVRALAFPFAAVIGSIIIGTAASMFFGFTMREGIAISAGFGWYTYAPTVIASAGSEFMVASAVSFMHNVIREVSGIVLIPILAKKIGYLEMTGIPGVAAMDVCMPIVERSCRHDTVVYSFAVGLLMCIVTSLLVPLAMGV
ncbi:MAG: lysine exporter LysO family protein [Firmicutes bacterium]|nr:lysine exporter LysO family protein [Bacillota bacterium]